MCLSQCGVTLGKPIFLRERLIFQYSVSGFWHWPFFCMDGNSGVLARYLYLWKRLLMSVAVCWLSSSRLVLLPLVLMVSM